MEEKIKEQILKKDLYIINENDFINPILSESIQTITIPEYEWCLQIGDPGLLINYIKGSKIPCRFHRFMQRLCLGFKWEKL
jgi:hypothetical protein